MSGAQPNRAPPALTLIAIPMLQTDFLEHIVDTRALDLLSRLTHHMQIIPIICINNYLYNQTINPAFYAPYATLAHLQSLFHIICILLELKLNKKFICI